MSWFEQSIMARKGVAGGKPGREHAITEAAQGKYHYTYGPFAKPVLTVDPGAVIACETHDAFEGKIKLANRQAKREAQLPVPQPAERPDLRQRRARKAIASRSTSSRSCRAVRSRSGPPA